MSRQASGNTLDNLVKDLRPFFRNIVINFDGEGEGEEGGEGSGEGEEGGESGEGASGTGTGSGEGSIKDLEKKRLSDEAAAHRIKAKAEKERADAAEARLREFEDKDKSDLEKATRDLTEKDQALQTAQATISAMAVDLAFYESGAHGLFKNPTTARKLIDLSSLKPGDDGKLDSKEVKALAEALLKAEPYLAADGSGSEGGSGPSSGTPANGRKTGKGANDEQLRKKFPALAARS